jgi:hypothetical protein
MKLTITFPDKIAKLVRRLPNPDEFVTRAVEEALTHEQVSPEHSEAEGSKWAKLVQRIESESTSLGDYYEQFKEDLAEFRRDFRFKHDHDEP